MFFDGMRCDGTSGKCQLDIRWYTVPKGPPPPDVPRIEESGKGFHGRVVGVGTFPKCTPPCWAKGEVAPCAAIDVRCELDAWKGTVPDHEVLSACIAAMEDAIRKRVP